MDLSAYDTVISNAVSFSKGIITRPNTRHICYCYSPTRMLWDRAHSYERHGIVSSVARHVLRLWDREAAKRPDQLLAISQTAALRIATYYRRDALVIPPPARIAPIADRPTIERGHRYLAVGRLVPHKRFDLLLQTFAKLKRPLDIIGDGPLRGVLARRCPSNVQLLGMRSDADVDQYYASARAVVIPNEEDWGLTAVEAMSHGTPVIALRAGGATETLIEGVTGEFFDDPILEALADAVHRFEGRHYESEPIRIHAQQYGSESFARRMHAIVEA